MQIVNISSEPTERDYAHFKKILEYFVHILRANNKHHPEEFINNEPRSGQGHKGHAIHNSYADFNDFSIGKKMTVNITAGFQLFNKTNYINWKDTSYNVRAEWNQTQDEITHLYLYSNQSDEDIGDKILLEDLGINDGREPDEKLKMFYNHFLSLLVARLSDNEMVNDLSEKLKHSKNIILRGSPGTGKTYLSRQIAANLIGIDEDELHNSEQYAFVQFHPSYDYTDFVEGLRPVIEDGQDGMAFELVDGIFKEFCGKAIQSNVIDEVDDFNRVWDLLIRDINESNGTYQMDRSSVPVTLNSLNNIKFNSPVATKDNVYKLYRGDETNLKYETYQKIVLDHMKKKYDLQLFREGYQADSKKKKFVFIIDEINRGEISKILGELFFSIDPGYRGDEKYGVYTQYSNLHLNKNEKFYIPDNVYIIGTMNDIDRSVDSFDFAMRRRFRFIEIKAIDTMSMWDSLLSDEEIKNATARLTALNQQISATDDLNENYHIGPSYFLQLPELNYDYNVLWEDYLQPLIEEYLRGSYEEKEKIEDLKDAYDLVLNDQDNLNG